MKPDTEREREALALLRVLDHHAASVGVPLSGEKSVALLRVFRRAEWFALARAAKLPAPSTDLIAAVLGRIRART